jgi:hypothetical protein
MPKLTLAFKGQALAVHHLSDGHVRIGRDPQCDIHIDSLAVAPLHVELTIAGESCQVAALDPEYPAYVNEIKVESRSLVHGDVLRVGKHSLAFATDGIALGVHVDEEGEWTEQNDPHEGGKRVRSTAYLQVLSGEQIGRIIPLYSMIRLGKGGGAMITHRSGGYYLSYLEGSMVTIDGVPIGTESVLLSDGCNIQIGPLKLQFYRGTSGAKH